MAPLCAVIIIDYYITRKGNVHVPSCYNGKKSGLYWFTAGINLCGVAAWLIGTSMGIPGLIGQYQPQIISNAAQYMYMMGWLLTFTTSATVYYAVTVFIKPQIFPTGAKVRLIGESGWRMRAGKVSTKAKWMEEKFMHLRHRP